MTKLTARQESIRDRAATYYPHLLAEVSTHGEYTVLTFSNPARPAAGTLSVDGRVHPRTKQENNLGSESYPGKPWAKVPLNQVMQRLQEMALA